MSTRPPGFFSKAANVLRALSGRPLDAPSERITLDVKLPTGYPTGRPYVRRGPRRSQYEVLHAAPGISYAEHDARVRAAMAAGIPFPSWTVTHGRPRT
jgi:hypothetical protein